MNKYQIILISIMFLLLLSITVYSGDIGKIDDKKIILIGNASIVSNDWEIQKWSGIEKDFNIIVNSKDNLFCVKEATGFKYEDGAKKKRDVPFELKTSPTTTTNLNVKYDSKTGLWCMPYESKDLKAGTTIKVGTSTIVAVYQPEKRIKYTNEQLETNFYLYKNGNISENLFVFVYNNSYKFGANDSTILNNTVAEFTYIINSTDYIYEIDKVNYPIFYNEIKKSIVSEKYQYDFKDICLRKFNVTREEIVEVYDDETEELENKTIKYTEEVSSDCQWTRLSDNSWKIMFNSDKDIDPVITISSPLAFTMIEKASTGSYLASGPNRLGVMQRGATVYYDRVYLEYSLINIMNGSTINSINLTIGVTDPQDEPNDCAIGSFLIDDPSLMSAQSIFENLTNESYAVFNCDVAGTYNFTFNSTSYAVGDLQNQLNSGKNWFVFGFKTVSDSSPEYNVTLTSQTFQINYTYPPNIACGSLNEAGKYDINNDLNANGADCITIASNNIEVNGNGHIIYNGSTGIIGNTYYNITIYNLTITNFSVGISLTSIDYANISNISITRSLDTSSSAMLVSGGSNNTFSNINIIDNDGYGLRVTGTTKNSAYSNIIISNCTYGDGSTGSLFVSGSNNTFNNFKITNFISPDSAGEIFGIYGIRVSSGSSNTFNNFEIHNSSLHAISLTGASARYNTFNNITIVGTNATVKDFQIQTNSLNGTYIINTSIAKYIISGASGGTLKIESPYGNINFLQPINGSGDNFSRDIFISSNLASVNISSFTLGMSKSANITLYGVSTTFTNPIIVKDNFKRCGIDTISPCFNFTSLNAGIVIFNVSKWSNYSIVESGTIDTTPPNINFTYPTNENGTIKSSFIINISSNDTTGEHYTFTDVNRSLISWWRFEEGTGTSFIDDMSLNNATCSAGSCPISEIGKWGYGLKFDGINDEINLPLSNSILNISSNMSFSIWFNTRKNGTEQTFLYVRNAWFLELHSSNYLVWVNNSGLSVTQCSSAQLPISQDTWNHAVFTSNDTTLSIYYNGVLVRNCSGNINNKTGSLNVKLGSTFSRYFNGTMDDIILFKRALNLSEVKSLYNATANQYLNDFSSMLSNTYTYTGYSVDSYGNKNQTETRTITLDTTQPYFTLIPLNVSINYTQGFNVTFNATDSLAFGSYTINWTALFIINQSGYLQNATANVAAGNYYINISINDTAGNSNSTIYFVNISRAIGIINGTINRTQGNFTTINGTANQNIYLNATNLTGYGTGKIYLNGSLINSGTMPLFNQTNLSIGFYNITFVYDGNENYTSDSDVWWVNISIPSDLIQPYLNITSPINGSTLEFDTLIYVFLNVTANDTNGISSYWYNVDGGVNVTFTNQTNMFIGQETGTTKTHIIRAYVNDTYNNVNSSSVAITTILTSQRGGGGGGGTTTTTTTTGAETTPTPISIPEIPKQNFFQTLFSIFSIEGMPVCNIRGIEGIRECLVDFADSIWNFKGLLIVLLFISSIFIVIFFVKKKKKTERIKKDTSIAEHGGITPRN